MGQKLKEPRAQKRCAAISGVPCLWLALSLTKFRWRTEDEIILTPGFLKSQQLEYDTKKQIGEKKSRRENRNQVSLLDFKFSELKQNLFAENEIFQLSYFSFYTILFLPV